ncbi:MAG: DUF4396 domain-containing protein, partial [Acidimicrobiia bacterium]
GRWPPSTSALYLKAPDQNLTFIVLANTDNMTVPFPGIGGGDLSRSALMLAFYRHFLFPINNEVELPEIDWMAAQAELVGELNTVEDEAGRLLLERELWSMRQALASSGQMDQADVLRRAAITAFPVSVLRSDGNTVGLPSRSEVVDPILSASALRRLSFVVMAWLVVVLGSLVWMATRLRRSSSGLWSWAVWMFATVLVGPIAPFVFGRESRSAGESARASVVCMAGYGLAWIGSTLILLQQTDESGPLGVLAAVLVVPLAVGLLAVRAPMLLRAGVRGYGAAVRRGLLAELTTMLAGVAVLLSVTVYFDSRWFSTLPAPTSPFFWAMLSLAALVGIAVQWPLHHLIQRRGFTVWPGVNDGVSVRLPTLRDSWWMLLGAVGFLAATIATVVTLFS